MNLLPAGLALTLPVAANAASAVVKRVGQTFQQMMASSGDTLGNSNSSATESLINRLSQIADDLRTWFSQHQIHSAFELELSSANTFSESAIDNQGELTIRGSESTRIRQLLQQQPEQLGQLKKLLSSIQATLPPGNGRSKLQITDVGSSITYHH